MTDNARDFTYDAANRLKTVSSNGVLLVTNDYDAKSRRVRKTTPEATATYFYDDWNLVEERIACTNGTNTVIRYAWGKDLSGTLQGAGGVGGLLYLTIDGSVYVPFYDNNGNVTHYCDATGAVVAAYTYDAFGNTIAQSGELANLFRHRFSTKYYDAESDLYYYGYRFYHPILMRWLNRDPMEEAGGVNLYAFCRNMMPNSVDFLGTYRMITRGLVVKANVGETGAARTVMRTIARLNAKQDPLTGKRMFDAKIVDLVLTPIDQVKKEIMDNPDDVYIVAHGALRSNTGVLPPLKVFVWPYFGDGGVEEGLDIAHNGKFTPLQAFGSKINPQNIFACYLTEGHRKIRRTPFSRRESSVVHLSESLAKLNNRLSRYLNLKPKGCTRKIRIYEGEYDGIGRYGSEDTMSKWPLKDESDY